MSRYKSSCIATILGALVSGVNFAVADSNFTEISTVVPAAAENIVRVTPANIEATIDNIRNYPQGTVFELEDGNYNVRKLFISNLSAPDSPYIIRAKNKHKAVFTWDGSDVGEGHHWSVFEIKFSTGIHFVDLRFEGRFSKHITVRSPSSGPPSRDIQVIGSYFEGSWYQSVYFSGYDSGCTDCTFTHNCLRREGSSIPQESSAVASFPWIDEQGNDRPSGNLWLRDSRVFLNHGEGVTFIKVDGLEISNNEIYDNRTANLYLIGSGNVTVRNNKFVSKQLFAPTGQPATGVAANVEPADAGDPRLVPQINYLIEGNVFDGGNHQGLKAGITWNVWDNSFAGFRYSHWIIRGNTFANIRREDVYIGTADPSQQAPKECKIDIPLDSPRIHIANPEAWEYISSDDLLKPASPGNLRLAPL